MRKMYIATNAMILCISIVCFPALGNSPTEDSDWILLASPTEDEIAICQNFHDPTPTLKILFGDRKVLGDYFYSLAMHAGEIPPEMKQEEFRNGINAVHFSSAQVVEWANQLHLAKKTNHPLLQLLFKHKFIEPKLTLLWPNARFRHLVAVSSGKNRALIQNITHEMLHVRFDEDVAFRDDIYYRWSTLSKSEKEAFVGTLKSYYKNEEASVVEEWGVRQAELALTNTPSVSSVTQTQSEKVDRVKGKDKPSPEADLNKEQESLLERPRITQAKPQSKFLVVKGLFVGMQMLQACEILDDAMDFGYTFSEHERSMYNPLEIRYQINSIVDGVDIQMSEIRHNIKDNNIFRPIYNPVDPRIDSLIEQKFKQIGNMKHAVESVVEDLNRSLASWVYKTEDGSFMLSLRNAAAIFADADQVVQIIVIMPELTNAWFNVADLSGETFAEKFIKTYRMPELQASMEIVDPADQGFWGAYFQQMGFLDYEVVVTWRHTSPAGYNLSISENKQIIVVKVPQESERNFD